MHHQRSLIRRVSAKPGKTSRFSGQVDAIFDVPRASAPRHEGPWHITFVCTGNICRSPFAQRSLETLISGSPLAGYVTTLSAGTHPLIGQPMDPRPAAIYAREFGHEAPSHRSRQLTSDMASSADLLLAMEADQRRTVLQWFPRAFPRTFLLTEYVDICRQLLSERGALVELPSATPQERLSALTAQACRHRTLGVGAPDIPDPYRRGDALHAQIAARILVELEGLLAILVNAAGQL